MELSRTYRSSSSAFAVIVGRCLLAATGAGALAALLLGLAVLLLAGAAG